MSRWWTGVTPLLSFYSTPLSPDSSASPHPTSSQSDQRARTRPTTYETCDAGQQVRLSAPHLSDPNIHLSIPYIFHFRMIFFPQSSIHLCLLPFFIESHNGLLQVGWRIYTSIYKYKQDLRRKKKSQEVKRQPGNTKCCVTMVSSWSPNHMNEDDK